MRKRQAFFRIGYTKLLKPVLLFQMDPEFVHDRFTKTGQILGKFKGTRALVSLAFNYQNPKLQQKILGLTYPNPVGLSAGFDKDALMIDILPLVGFGHLEIGSVTGKPSPGNPKPRLWRLKNSRSIVVHYGLKSAGALAVKEKIEQSKLFKTKKRPVPLGISIARANLNDSQTLEDQIADYRFAYQNLYSLADSITINISCPNLEGGQPFCEPDNLEQLLIKLRINRTDLAKDFGPKPHFLKLSPDQTEKTTEKIVMLALKYGVDGFICSNLTKPRENPGIIDSKVPEKGGMSGKVVEEKSNQLLELVYRLTEGKVPLVGCGGVFTAEDAYRKIREGACLIQMITGMLFEGPQVIGEINRGLLELLKKDGFSSIQEAVGVDVK